MLKFSANLGFLWPELALPDRIYAASLAGFSAVECHWPYQTDSAELRAALNATGLVMLALNTEPGDVSTEEFGLAAVPGKQDMARAAFDKALDYAIAINAKNVHVMAGVSGDSDEVTAVFVENIVYAAQHAGKEGVGVIIEPINRLDHPGYALHTVSQGLEVIERIRQQGLSNVRLMFDCYHAQITEADLVTQLNRALPYIEHIQIASVPGRAEPDHGELDYPVLFNLIETLGYDGYIGAEYQPLTTTEAGLGWYQPFRPPSKD